MHDLFLCGGLFFCRILFQCLAAGTHHQPVGNDDLGGHQIGIFGVVERLGNRFITQLEGIDLHRSELGRSKFGKQGIVERKPCKAWYDLFHNGLPGELVVTSESFSPIKPVIRKDLQLYAHTMLTSHLNQ